MKLAVPRESFPGERRVALVPASLKVLIKMGYEVLIETSAGVQAGYADDDYRMEGGGIVDREACFQADVVVQVRALGANLPSGAADLSRYRPGQIVIAMCDPLGNPSHMGAGAKTGASVFALELIPRISRAQSMDVLSSMATVAGYRAVLMAALELPKMFPLMMTAAGTLAPAHVFVIGAGVSGLQAIATAKRLGGVVQAYDVRPAVRDQVESVGAKFVELPLEAGASEDQGGYAKALGDEFYRRQRELMAQVVARSDVVITTAAIPGKPSPLLITEQAVAGMTPGSVIIDLAAERGGNCELSQADQRRVEHGVVILAPTNLASDVPYHASQMFAKNVTSLLQHLTEQGTITIKLEDEITAGTLATHRGEVIHPRLRPPE